jgi:hypothetical protein
MDCFNNLFGGLPLLHSYLEETRDKRTRTHLPQIGKVDQKREMRERLKMGNLELGNEVGRRAEV